MIAAFLTTLLFAVSAMCGHRTATKIGVRSLIGALTAVGGVIGLTFFR